MSTLEILRLQREQKHEKKDKNKARGLVIFYLIILALLLLIPFTIQPPEPEQYQGVLVDFDQAFTENKASMERSSSKPAAAAPAAEEVEETVEEEAVPEETVTEETPPPPPEKPKLTPEVKEIPKLKNNTKAVLTAPNAEIKLPDEMLKVEVSENAKVKDVGNGIIEVTEEASTDFSKDFKKIFSKLKKKKKKTSKPSGSQSSGDGSGTTSGSGDSKTDGEGDSGSSDDGDAETDGQGDSGTSGDDFDGDGLLTRKVIYRANLESIIKKSGRIVINLCVNRDGKVIYSKIDEEASSITNKTILRKAEAAAGKYRYEKDYTVAERQCGKLTFIVKIQK